MAYVMQPGLSTAKVIDGLDGQIGSVKSSLERVRQRKSDYLLVFRFALLNITALALVGAAFMQGWIQTLIAHDQTHIVKLIIAAFVCGMAQLAYRIVQISHELNAVDQSEPDPRTRVGAFLAAARRTDPAGRATLAQALRMKLATRMATLRHVAALLVMLGLVGTVVGFMIALAGVDSAEVGNVDAIGPMVSALLAGMAVALHTTLVGTLLNIWLSMNCRLVEGGATHLVTRLMERGESDAQH